MWEKLHIHYSLATSSKNMDAINYLFSFCLLCTFVFCFYFLLFYTRNVGGGKTDSSGFRKRGLIPSIEKQYRLENGVSSGKEESVDGESVSPSVLASSREKHRVIIVQKYQQGSVSTF